MKKYIYLLSLFLLTMFTVSAQIGMNTETANTSAALDVFSESKGVLFPRMTTNDRNIHLSVAAPGLMFYNTTENCLNINVGTRNSPEWACLEDSCPILPPGPEPTGKRVRWGAYKNFGGATYVLAGYKIGQQPDLQYSKTNLFIKNPIKIFNENAINGYRRFSFQESDFDHFDDSVLNNNSKYFIDKYDVISIVADLNTDRSKGVLHKSLKEFSEVEGKALFITLEGINDRGNPPNPVYDRNILESFGIPTHNLRVLIQAKDVEVVVSNTAVFSPNESFGDIVKGSRIAYGGPNLTVIPPSDLPENAIVYLTEKNTGYAVAFSIGNVFFISSKSFHEGSMLTNVTPNSTNAYLFIKKYVAAFLDHVVIP